MIKDIELKNRLFLGGGGTFLLFVLSYISHYESTQWFLVAVLALSTSIALWEYFCLARIKESQPLESLAILFSTLCIFFTHYASLYPSYQLTKWTFFLFVYFFIFFLHFYWRKEVLITLAVTAFAWVYVVFPMILLVYIGNTYGKSWVLYGILVTKIADMGAYLVGKAVGRSSLAASISSGKTIEGFIGGLAFSLFSSACVMHLYSLRMPWIQSVALPLSMAFLGQLGDLAESLLKRDAQVKDSNQVPGLGGALDILDSLLFTIPFLYVYLLLSNA